MTRFANRWLVLVGAIGLSSCTQPVTPFAPEHQPAPVPARVKIPPPPAAPAAAQKPGTASRIPLDSYFERHQAGTVLTYDVRAPFFHRLGHIPGSINWPKNELEKQLDAREAEISRAQEKGQLVVVYCTDLACPDARAVADRLAQRGHSVAVLEGGWESWKTSGLSTS